MNPIQKNARSAGFWYLMMLITGPIGLLYVPSQIIVSGDAAATAQNIVSSEFLFRTGIFASICCQIANIFVALALARLFKEVDEKQCTLLVSLVLVMVPMAILNELNSIIALIILHGDSWLNSFTPAQLQGLVMTFLKLHDRGIQVAGFFWGLWLLPMGLLTVKSGFAPKLLGYFLIGGCVSYVLDSSLVILAPQLRGTIVDLLMMIPSIAEVWMVGWLLYKGFRSEK